MALEGIASGVGDPDPLCQAPEFLEFLRYIMHDANSTARNAATVISTAISISKYY